MTEQSTPTDPGVQGTVARPVVGAHDDHVTYPGRGASGLRTYLYPLSRIIVGEVRQEECLDLLTALNSGIPSMATPHRNTG
jgi:hypothetical protein